MEVWDIQYVLQDSFCPFAVGKHVDFDVACAGCRDGTVVTQDDFCVFREGGELREPSSM